MVEYNTLTKRTYSTLVAFKMRKYIMKSKDVRRGILVAFYLFNLLIFLKKRSIIIHNKIEVHKTSVITHRFSKTADGVMKGFCAEAENLFEQMSAGGQDKILSTVAHCGELSDKACFCFEETSACEASFLILKQRR